MSSTSSASTKLNVGILIFDNVEVLDFTGPYEVFSRTRTEPGVESRRSESLAPFRVITVAQAGSSVPISATGGLKVMAEYGFDDVPMIDILVVPGGYGTRPLVNDEATISWIQKVASTAKIVTSVCTGALLLAKAGLLDGRRATSNWASLDMLDKQYRNIEIDRSLRWVEDGNVISSAGVAAGIDMAFHVVERVLGKEIADETAHYIEYPRRRATDPRSSA
jgi:transcriptional regulator GlxA family with amidase domain